MLGYDYIHDASLERLVAWWEHPETIPEDFNGHGLDEVAYGLCRHKPSGIQLLRAALYSEDIDRRLASLCFLADPDLADDEFRRALVDAFDPESTLLSSAVLRSCVRLRYFPFPESLIRELWHHPDQRFAATSMVYLAHSLPDEMTAILELALSDSNPRMREYACDEVGDYGIASLSPMLERLLSDEHPDVVASASSNLGFFKD